MMTSDGYQPGGGDPYNYGERLVGRVMAEEYNLAVQRGDQRQAGDAMLRLIGMKLASWFSR